MQRRTFRPSDFSRQSSSASLLTASLTRRSVESYIWLLKRCFHQTRGDWRALHAWRANGRVAKIKKVLIGSTHTIPVVVADLFRHDAKVERSTRDAEPRAKPSGLAIVLLALAVIAVLLMALRGCS